MDRRFYRSSGKVAHDSLRKIAKDVTFTAGEPMQVSAPLADLLRSADGARERQVLHGDGFTVIDRDGDYAFGFSEKDGYCGWLRAADLRAPLPASHWVASAGGTHCYPAPRVKMREIGPLPMGARVQVLAQEEGFSQTPDGWVPSTHLREIGSFWDDPVTVAEGFLGTPYLWGGNSRAGLDCSGLVQLALHGCGIACPADSDLQARLGSEIAEGAPLRRGDLLFWLGHVAMVTGPDQLIHANGHSMSVAYEGALAAQERIAASGGGGITARRRISRSGE